MVNKKVICLFTAHSPESGGGAVILKSLIQNLPEFNIKWQYVTAKAANNYEAGYLGKGFMGGNVLKDIFCTFLMLSNNKVSRINDIVKDLLQIECDAYWIVSHNEGLRVAYELSRRQNVRPVHLTVHDDWAGALCARSKRYKWLSSFAKKMTIKTLKVVDSYDVISDNMRDYYFKLTDIKGEVCHRYLDIKSLEYSDKVPIDKTINIGHIGSIYSNIDFLVFLKLLLRYQVLNDVTVKVHLWGYKHVKDSFPKDIEDILVHHGNAAENNVIPLLQDCHFVYCMYPLSNATKIFSETSLPTKLTTYTQVCRPIFGQGSTTSSLYKFITGTKTGIMWVNDNIENGFEAIDTLLNYTNSDTVWINARNSYFGVENLNVVRRIFNNQIQ